MVLSLVFVGVVVVLFRFTLSLGRFLNCLIVLEKFKVLLLFASLLFWDESHVLFLSFIVIFTVEVTLRLVVLTRL